MKSHIHAQKILQYALDSLLTSEPWLLWEYLQNDLDIWLPLARHPTWSPCVYYRRVPALDPYPVALSNVTHGQAVFVPELTYNCVLRCEFDASLERDVERFERRMLFATNEDATKALNVFNNILRSGFS